MQFMHKPSRVPLEVQFFRHFLKNSMTRFCAESCENDCIIFFDFMQCCYICHDLLSATTMKETLSSISQRTGYSITTVSRVLSGNAEKHRISKKTIEKVLKDAREHNYSPSLVAQSLRTNKTNTIGLLLPSLANPYFADVASVIISEVHRRNYTAIVIDTMENAKNFNDSASLLLSRRVDGIIAVPCGTDSSLIESINDNYLPVVLIDRYYDNTHLSFVTTNNHKGGLMATRHLIGMGHRRIACIQGTVTSNPSKERVRGYRDAMIEEGYGEEICIVGNEYSIQNGYLETKLLLESENPPTAIFTLSNTITLGALKAIREASLKIPEDISLLSFDNYSYMDFMEPPITRISQPTEDMGKLATKILFDRIDSVPNNTSQLKLSPSLIAKESVRSI